MMWTAGENELFSAPGSFSRRSSVATIPSNEGANRLDLLIEEQRTAVINAQDGLRQSLAILEGSNSKEEKESVRLQVQSLLSRAEELVVLLRVISEIRTELGHVQREIKIAKKAEKNHMYARQHWLETRLETLLLTKKRGRPGGRGRRTQVVPTRPSMNEQKHESKRKSIGTISTLSSPTKSIACSSDSFSDRDTTFSIHDSVVPASNGGGATVTIPSDSESSEESRQGSEEEVSIEDQSRKYQSQLTNDSDAWHSEGETNCTLAETSCKNSKESQVLSDNNNLINTTHRRLSVTFNDPPVSAGLLKEEVSDKQDEDAPTPSDLPVNVSPKEKVDMSYPIPSVDSKDALPWGFYPPRPVEVFGSCSWNILPLAIRSNPMATEETEDCDSDEERSASILRAGLDGFFSEIKVLKRLIQEAASATALSGHLISASKRTALRSRSARSKTMPSTVMKSASPRSSKFSSSSLPPLINGASSPTGTSEAGKKSRKLYGKKIDVYPRTSETWFPKESKCLTSCGASQHTQEQASTNLQASLRLMSCRSKSRQQSRSHSTPDSIDIFNEKFHREQHIQYLILQTESPLASVRRDSIQTLGSLPHIGTKALNQLYTKLLTDDDYLIRFHILYSLLQQGEMDDLMLGFVDYFLSGGPPALQSELLQLLCQDCVLKLFSEKFEAQTSPIKNLEGILTKLLASKDGSISFFSAVLLSHAHLNREACIQRLKENLHPSIPSSLQSMALSCLLRYWACGNKDVLSSGIMQMSQLSDWKLRVEAIDCLCEVSKQLEDYKETSGEGILEILMKRLTNEPILAARIAIGKLLKLLKLDVKAENIFLSDLDKRDEVTRSNAVLALSAFELRGKKTVQLLRECMELDPSVYVRILVARTFGELKHSNPLIMEYLMKKSKGQGIVARECMLALQKIHLNLEKR